jgi:hypothetical protein
MSPTWLTQYFADKDKYKASNKFKYNLFPKSTHTGLDCVKNSATNMSSLGPLKAQ